MGLIANVTAGEIIQSAWGNAVRDRAVQSFTDAAQRTAQWPAPPLGALSVLDSWPGCLHQWDGAAWWVQQSGYTVLPTDPNSFVNLIFPKPFAALPYELGAWGEGTAVFSVVLVPLSGQLVVSGGPLVVRTIGGTGSVPNTAVGFTWRARGRSS